MKRHLAALLPLLGFVGVYLATLARAQGGVEMLPALYAAEQQAPSPIHFHYFAAEVAAASQSQPLDAQALHALGERWVKRCSKGGVFADLAATFAPDPGLSASSREALLKRFDRSRFEALATATWRKAGAVLPQDSLNLCVELVDKRSVFVDQAMRGVAGLTAGSGKIMLKVSVDAEWVRMLPFALAHELHHSYWAAQHMDENAYSSGSFTLADYMIFEGRADYFAHQLYPDILAPWDHALTDQQFAELWPRLRDQMGATDFPTMRAVMFGDPGRDIPRWTGYSIGYRLVNQRMQQEPVMDIATMSAAPASAFIPDEPAEPDSMQAQELPGATPIGLGPGSGSFVVAGGGGYQEKRITVFYHKPESFHEESPVMMVIPGAGRNGDDYRDAWVSASEHYGVLILSPSYPEKFYPEYWSYNLAGMTREVTLDLSVVIATKPDEWALDDAREELESTIGMYELVGSGVAHQLVYQFVLLSKAGMLAGVDIHATNAVANRNPEKWIFDDFDRIFETVKDELGLEAEEYDLFGHSAGGQILHRLALFHPNGRADRILAANAGWYTVPTFEQEFPYGLRGSGMAEQQLEAAFGTHLVVFLGEEDDADETRGMLRRTPQADQQGTHRLERGKHFFREASEAAKALGVNFEWKMEIVPGVGHDYQRMSQAAAEYLYGGDASR